MIQIVLERPTPSGRGTCFVHPEGWPTGYVASGVDPLLKNLGGLLDELYKRGEGNLKNIFYSLAEHSGLGGDKPELANGSFSRQTVLPFQVKGADPARSFEYLWLVAEVLQVDPQALVMVSTGEELEILAHLKIPFRSFSEFREQRSHYKEVISRMGLKLEAAELPGNLDPAVFSPTQLFRLPSSINEKGGVSHNVSLLQDPGLVPLSLDLVRLAGFELEKRAPIAPPAPTMASSIEPLASALNGYWKMGKSGPLHPDYGDLARLYRESHSYVTCAPRRIFTFQKTHYSITDDLIIKGWLEGATGYPDAVRETHAIEFLNKILRTGAISREKEEELFETSTLGKLNCRNGMIDVVTGELSPHCSEVGFKYVLPYDYLPDETSIIFLDWLRVMMQGRDELIESVLDLMAYCLCPGYDSHVFGFFVGEGRNGKSTVLQIMMALLGTENYAAISLSRLGSNRFAAANLEGKLANISEESSGEDLTLEETNVLKALTSSAEIEVEQKGERAFKLKNKAKMMFSANKTPRFHETGKAIRERLLVIPFDYAIAVSDSNVGKRLIAEVPKICSFLVRRIRDNMAKNDGRFVVSKGGAIAKAAQDKVLLAGNSVAEWAQAHLDSGPHLSDDDYVLCSAVYSSYSDWCHRNNYRTYSLHSFSQHLGQGILSSIVKSKMRRINFSTGNKLARIYPHTRWKEVII